MRKKGCFVQDGTATKGRPRQISELSSYKTLNAMCQERSLLKRVTQNGLVTCISKLRTRDVVTRGKILSALLASLRWQITKVFEVEMTGEKNTMVPRQDQLENNGSRSRGSGLIRPALF